VSNENILLQTLGFDVAIDHPHTHVVKCCQMVKGEGIPFLSSFKIFPPLRDLVSSSKVRTYLPTLPTHFSEFLAVSSQVFTF
jgi:cyclin T